MQAQEIMLYTTANRYPITLAGPAKTLSEREIGHAPPTQMDVKNCHGVGHAPIETFLSSYFFDRDMTENITQKNSKRD